jgi:hypothetical protein
MDRDMDDLFKSLRQENQRSVTFEDELGEEEEDDYDLGARYDKLYAKDREFHPVHEDEEVSSEEEEEEEEEENEEQRDKLLQRLEELRQKKQLLGPPGRVKKQDSKSEAKAKVLERPQTARPVPKPAESRPVTALPRTPSLILSTPSKKTPKTDRVALFQQRQKQWKSQPFLAANSDSNRQGRKLNLAPHKHMKDFAVVKLKSVHDYIRNDYVAPHLKRRDDIRLSTRAKMMQENCD